MKRRQKTTLGLLISSLSLLLAVTPTQAEPNVTLTPSNLTIAGTRCLGFNLGCTPVRRNLLLQTNQTISNPRMLSLDLNRADGATVLPADAIRSTLSADSVPPNQPLAVSVQFDFNHVSSGEYSGVLLLIYADGQLNVPVTLRVKDHWLLPSLVLLAGIGLGVGVSAYRTQGMARDEIAVKVARIRIQMRFDPELATSFQAKMTAHLVDVETALENRNWEAAQQAVGQAQSVWNKWRKGREDWLAQLKYQSSLVQRLEEGDLNPDASYIQVIRHQLEDRVADIADRESPQQLRQDLEDLQQQINRYLEGKAKLDQFNQSIAELPPERQQLWKVDVQRLQNELDNLSPSDREAFKNWQQDLKDASDKLVAAIEQQTAARTPSLMMAASLKDTTAPKLLALPPAARPLPELDAGKAASDRLFWFNWLSYILAVGLLAGAGFGELYVAKPTFGGNAWNDYFALLAWGFGAEATRDAITKVVQNWRLSGFPDSNLK